MTKFYWQVGLYQTIKNASWLASLNNYLIWMRSHVYSYVVWNLVLKLGLHYEAKTNEMQKHRKLYVYEALNLLVHTMIIWNETLKQY